LNGILGQLIRITPAAVRGTRAWYKFTAAVSAAVLGDEGLPADASQASIYGREMALRSFTNGASRRDDGTSSFT
jgi:hypothetical protein